MPTKPHTWAAYSSAAWTPRLCASPGPTSPWHLLPTKHLSPGCFFCIRAVVRKQQPQCQQPHWEWYLWATARTAREKKGFWFNEAWPTFEKTLAMGTNLGVCACQIWGPQPSTEPLSFSVGSHSHGVTERGSFQSLELIMHSPACPWFGTYTLYTIPQHVLHSLFLELSLLPAFSPYIFPPSLAPCKT